MEPTECEWCNEPIMKGQIRYVIVHVNTYGLRTSLFVFDRLRCMVDAIQDNALFTEGELEED